MNTLHTPISALDKMLALNLNVSLWSARKKITFEDVNHIPNNDLPPQDLATLGSKKIAPPESLRVFSTLKARAVTLLDKYGVRFMSGWGIPDNLATEVLAELATIRQEFEVQKTSFLNEYDTLVSDWINKHPQWTDMLASAVDSSDYVRSRLQFEWQLYRVQSTFETTQSGVDLGLDEAVHGLGNTLFDDVVKTAQDTWRKVYEGKSSVTHKALSPLKTMHSKLVGLSFIEPHVLPVTQIINETLSRMPKRGNITGAELVTLQGLVCLLRDKDALISHAKKLLDGQAMDNILDGLLQQNTNIPQQMAAYVDVYDPMLDGEEVSPLSTAQNSTVPIIADSLGLW